MNTKSREDDLKNLLKAMNILLSKGFYPKGGWLFEKDCILYDLSAADVSKIDTIVKNRLFITHEGDN